MGGRSLGRRGVEVSGRSTGLLSEDVCGQSGGHYHVCKIQGNTGGSKAGVESEVGGDTARECCAERFGRGDGDATG